MTRLTEGNRTVDYGYDSDGNLTSITRNGFRYDYTYDGFGNLVDTKIAGKTVSTNSYAPNNGTHTGTAYADGSRTSQDRDAYGRVIRSYITDAGGTRHQIDATVYDNDGNVKKYTDTANSLTTEYDYDDAGRVARSVANKENSSAYNGSRVQYAYSKGGKIANISYDMGDGQIKSYVYTYARDGLPEKSVFPDASYQTLSYDNLRRNSQKVYYPVKNAAAAKRLYTTAAFTEGQSSASSHKGTTALVKTYTNKIGTADVVSEYAYAYDEWGNITGITESVRGNKGTYTYNEYGELTKSVEVYTKKKTTQITCTYDYTYDSGENIKTEKVTGPSGTTTHTYTYDSVWKDKLISYDGNSITYDAMGNPTNYMGAAMTWDVKGNLTSVSGRNKKSAAYTYLSDGQRYTKTTGGKTTTYRYNNGLLLSETTGNEVINYYYDSDGTILGIGYKKGSDEERHYFFEKNAFGDVIAVYRNSDSVLIGTYEYDLWGNPVSVNEAASGRDTDGILQKNPFRYRCYYYDTETGFYYLNSRYYDPQIRRFISADSMVTNTGTDVLGYNLYSYCNNSPLNKTDSDGHFPKLSQIFECIARAALVTAGIMAVIALAALAIGSGGGAAAVLAVAAGGTMTAGEVAAASMAVAGGAVAAGEVASGIAIGAGVLSAGANIAESVGNSGYNKNTIDKQKNSNSNAVPDKAKNLAQEIKNNNGTPPKGYKGGKVYQNNPVNGGQKLPSGINYKEYDVNPYVKGQGRGVERLVIGDDGSVWYTYDHYQTFIRVE